MLGDSEAIAMIAVKDINAASKFYEGTLGLSRLSSEADEVITYRSGSSKLNIYRSQFAATNKATCVLWNVGTNIEAIVADLKSKGVSFEHYDMPDMKVEGDIYRHADMKVAWFKDPDGNILSIVNE